MSCTRSSASCGGGNYLVTPILCPTCKTKKWGKSSLRFQKKSGRSPHRWESTENGGQDSTTPLLSSSVRAREASSTREVWRVVVLERGNSRTRTGHRTASD